MKSLKHLSLQELWQLFPITLVPHRNDWEQIAHREIHNLHTILKPYHPAISHIGSTAIPAILAKPIIDLLVEIPLGTKAEEIISLMENHGYLCMNRTRLRISFNKGYTPEGYAHEVFHIHFHNPGDNDEIIFRDYLRENPSEALRYQQLKQTLIARFPVDRDAYTQAKSSYIKSIVDLARHKPLA